MLLISASVRQRPLDLYEFKGQLVLHSEFKASQDSTVRSCLKHKTKQPPTPTKRTHSSTVEDKTSLFTYCWGKKVFFLVNSYSESWAVSDFREEERKWNLAASCLLSMVSPQRSRIANLLPLSLPFLPIKPPI